MAKQFDNSIAVFDSPSSGSWSLAAATIGLLALAGGFIFAMVSRNGAFATILGIAGVAVAASLYISGYERRRKAAQRNSLLAWDTALPEIQRETLNGEVHVLANFLEVGPDQIGDLQSAYIVAEDLALRQIQQEESTPVMRHIAVCGIPFDAVLVKNGVVNCIDVAFLVTPDVRQEKLDAAVRKMSVVKRSLATGENAAEARLMLVLVTQLTPTDEQTLRSLLKTKRFVDTPVDIDIRLLDFEALQRIYVTD